MKKNKLILLFLIISLIIGFYYEIKRNIDKPTFYKKITKNIISEDFKNIIKSKLFKSYYLEKKILILEEDILEKNKFDLVQNRKIRDLLLKNQYVKFEKSLQKEINFDDKKLKYQKFFTSDLLVGKNPSSKPLSSSYIDFSDEKLFIMTGDGLLSYISFFNIINNEERLFAKIIPTNINEFTNTDEKFELNSYIGIKDIKIIDEFLYMSYSNKHKSDCYSTSILRGKINFDKILFEKFFDTNRCVAGKNDFGLNGKWSQGGRIINGNTDNIFFSVGTWGEENLAQEKNNIYGKIISINKINSNFEVVSYGHRNPQGLIIDDDFIISTEHGPSGGDEINIIDLKNSGEKNYGWPISSYGEPVIGSNRRDELYKKAPHYKSHKKYGFIEPIKYWTPSIGISELAKISNNSNKNNLLVVSALGTTIEEGDKSLHFLEFDKSYSKILYEQTLPIGERIRDLIFIKEYNCIAMFLESSAEIAFIF